MNNESVTINANLVLSVKRIEALKALLKAYYLGFYTPGKNKLQPYYDYPLNSESYYEPGMIESCEVKFEPTHNSVFGPELAATIKYSDNDSCLVTEYWPISDINTWDN